MTSPCSTVRCSKCAPYFLRIAVVTGNIHNNHRFFPLASMKAWYSYEHLSVCLSVCRMRALWRNKSLPTFLDLWKVNSSSFPIRRMVAGERPLYLKFFLPNWPPPLRYSLVAPQPLDLAKKSSIITNSMTKEVDYELSNEPKINSERCP